MSNLIDKAALVAEIERRQDMITKGLFSIPLTGRERADATFEYEILGKIKEFLDTLEVKDPYEQVIQYPSIEDGIKAHAEDYSWNIESELFQQLTPEQQKLWRKEIEQAVISGGYSGLNFARDTRYKENLEVKEVDLELNSFDATVCKICNTYLKEMDKDAIVKALEPYKDGDKVKVIIKA